MSKKQTVETNREHWLAKAADLIRAHYGPVFDEHFGDEGAEHLKGLLVSAGFPSRSGANGKVIGQCWAARASADGRVHHIFISPLLVDPVRVVATLAHEMVHAADDGENKHKGAFTKAVRALGLEGKPTATYAGEEFEQFVTNVVVPELGDYPHVGLTPTVTEKTQKTYMLKIAHGDDYEGDCEFICRATQKQIDNVGLPTCACGEPLEVVA